MDAHSNRQGWLTPGQEVAGLRVERFLGQGAFSTVYLARDVLIDRVVALKVLSPLTGESGDPVAADEVLKEARLVGRLSSPHIVTLYRVHPPAEEGLWMFEMEYVEGGSLAQQLEGAHRLPWGQALPLLHGVAAGLHDAHAAGIVHGDLKAGNVLLTLNGTARLADFGLARLVGDAPLRDRGSGSVGGTPLYMAPEVMLGRGGDAAADVWSFGVLTYRTLAGRYPFESDDFRVLFHAVQMKAPPALGPDVPRHLAELVFACLAKRPEDRPSARAVLEQLEEHRRGPHGTTPADPVPRSELIGRDEELKAAQAALDAGEDVLVTGAAGSGRSAFLAQLAALGRARGETWITVAVPPAGGVLVRLFDALRAALGEDAAAHATEERFGAGATLLREVLQHGVEAHRGQGPWIVRELLRILGAAGPTVLALDDVEQVDEEDRALLAGLQSIAHRTVLTHQDEKVLGTAEEALRAMGGGHALRRVRLDGLPPESIYALLESRSRALRVDARVAERIVDLVGGSPRFALELMEHLEATGGAEVHGDTLVPGERWGEVALPQRLQDLAARRLTALPPEDRELLDVAAVDGASFDGGAVAAVTGRPLLDILRRLQHLCRRSGVVVAQDDGYRFASRMLHDTVYEHVAPELRRALHLQLAEHLEARQDRHGVDPERIGEHWARAGHAERARPHLLRAMGQAVRREQLRHAMRLAEKARAHPEDIDGDMLAEHFEDLLGLAHAYQQAGAVEEVKALYARLEELTDADERRRARILAHAAWTRFATVGLDEAKLEVLRRLADDPERSPAQAQALATLGRQAMDAEDYVSAERYLRQAEEAWAALGEEGERGAQRLLLGISARRLGRIREAEQSFVEAASLNRRAGHRLYAVMCDVNRLLCRYEQGKTGELQSGLVRAIHQLELIDATNQADHTRCILASVLHSLGDAEGAMATQQEVLERAAPLHYVPLLTMAYPNLARWRLAGGEFEEAGKLREAWGTLHTDSNSREAVCEQAIFDARWSALRGDEERARERTEEAVRQVLALKGLHDRVKQAAALAESTYYAVPPECLTELHGVLEDADLPEDPVLEVARGLRDGALALAAVDVDPERLRRAGRTLRDATSGESRASRLGLAGLLLAEAAYRAGDGEEATEEAHRALATAVALQNVWLQLHLLGLLARVHPRDVFRERRDALIAYLARKLPEDARERFVAFWTRGSGGRP